MTLLHMDGFEMGDHAFRYSAIGGGLSFGTGANTRFNYGRYASAVTGNLMNKSLSAPVTKFITGFASKPDFGSDSADSIRLYGDGGTVFHLGVRWMTSGAIAFYRGGTTQIAITTGAVLSFNVWHYVEISLTVSDTVGVAKCRLDGVEVLSFTGDTRNAGTNQSIDMMRVDSASSNNQRIDDWYISDDTGPAPYNDFLGDVRVCTLSPTGPGNSTQLTPSAAPNWGCVDEQPYSATDFVTGGTTGLKDTYVCADLPSGVTAVHGVQLGMIAKKSDAGVRLAKTVVRSGGTDYSDAAAQALGTSDGWLRNLRTLNPNGNVAWTPAAVNAMEIGVEVG